MIPISKPIIEQDEIDAVVEVLKSGMIASGPKTQELEKRFTELTGASYAIATTNGTTALHTALYAIGIKPGDEVITTPFTFVATANSIVMCGGKPVFVDIDKQTYNIDPRLVEKAITKKTKAIIAVDLYGQPADYDEIMAIAKEHNLYVVADAAQSINATYKNKKSGNIADITTFSLYATKNIMSGEGGMITTNNQDFYERARRFRNHGQSEKTRYIYEDIGYNYRMPDLLSAIGVVQMGRVEEITKKRQSIAAKYNDAFKNITGIVIPITAPDRTHVYHQYTLRITPESKKMRDELKNYLTEKGIGSNIYYPKPLYDFPHLGKNKPELFPATQAAKDEVLSIPVHPLLTEENIQYIIETISSI